MCVWRKRHYFRCYSQKMNGHLVNKTNFHVFFFVHNVHTNYATFFQLKKENLQISFKTEKFIQIFILSIWTTLYLMSLLAQGLGSKTGPNSFATPNVYTEFQTPKNWPSTHTLHLANFVSLQAIAVLQLDHQRRHLLHLTEMMKSEGFRWFV
jgi:hypothetical protein